MTLAFINPSRNYDLRNAVRYRRHDGMFEVEFYVAAAATGGMANGRGAGASEAACLSAFDASRTAIHDAARRAYAGGRRLLHPDLLRPALRPAQRKAPHADPFRMQ